MKNHILIALSFFVLGILFTLACLWLLVLSQFGGAGDWSYDGLPGRYEVIRASSYNITLAVKDEKLSFTAHRVIDPCVTRFCWNDRYIGVEQAFQWDGKTELTEELLRYYVVDTESEVVKGPYTFQEHQTFLEENHIELSTWTATMPKPKGAR